MSGMDNVRREMNAEDGSIGGRSGSPEKRKEKRKRTVRNPEREKGAI